MPLGSVVHPVAVGVWIVGIGADGRLLSIGQTIAVSIDTDRLAGRVIARPWIAAIARPWIAAIAGPWIAAIAGVTTARVAAVWRTTITGIDRIAGVTDAVVVAVCLIWIVDARTVVAAVLD